MVRRIASTLYRIETKINYRTPDGRRLQKRRGPCNVECGSIDEAKKIELEWKLQLRRELESLPGPTHDTTMEPIVHSAPSMGLSGADVRRIEQDVQVLLDTHDWSDSGWDYDQPLCFGNLTRVTISRKHRLGISVRASGSVYRRLLSDCGEYSGAPGEFVQQFRGYLAAVEDEVSERTHEPLSHASYNRIIAIARTVWNTALQLELVELNPITAVRFPSKRETARNRTLTDAEIQATSDYLKGHHEGLYYAFLFCLRNPIGYGDLRQLRCRNVDLDTNSITYSRKKTHVKACPIIYPETTDYIKRRVEAGEKLVFDLPQYHRWHMDHIEVDGEPITYTWHDIRHHAATWLVRQGIPLQMVASIGGWSTVQMVERYHDLKAEHASDFVRSKLLQSGTQPPIESGKVEKKSMTYEHAL